MDSKCDRRTQSNEVRTGDLKLRAVRRLLVWLMHFGEGKVHHALGAALANCKVSPAVPPWPPRQCSANRPLQWGRQGGLL